MLHVEPTATRELVHETWLPATQEPRGLSPEAQWADLKPENISVLDWVRYYPGDDQELWPDVIEEIKWEVEHGEAD